MDTTRLGQIALTYDLIDEEALGRCLDLQETSTPPRCLGEIFVDEGVMTQDTLRRLLSAQRKEVERSGGQARLERAKIAASLSPGTELQGFLAALDEVDADELHLCAGARPAARVSGVLETLRPEPLVGDEVAALCAPLLEGRPGARARLAAGRSVEFASGTEVRWRVLLTPQRAGLSAMIRKVGGPLPSWEQLPRAFDEVPRLKPGLVLVTGPPSSGKSTSQAAMIARINAERRLHVVCVEEVLAPLHESERCLVTQLEVGKRGWGRTLAEAERIDADVIVLGDLSAPGRVIAALDLAEAGHLVIASTRTSCVESTLLALLRSGGAERRDSVSRRLSRLLRLVVAQQLVPGLEGKRHLAVEVLRNTPAVAHMIREQRFAQLGHVLQTSRERGMSTMDESLYELAARGEIALGEALARARDPDGLQRRLAAQGGPL